MYRHCKTYEIRYTDVDVCDRLKLSALLSLMEESACLSAQELGFGYDALKPKNYGFILVNWYVELSRTISFGDSLTIVTCEEKVGVATSRWCLIDLGNFSMLPAAAVFNPEIVYNECRSTDFNSWKIPEITQGELAYSKFASYSDYDHYNHVNNTKYGDILIDAFSVEEMKELELRTVQIKYVKQCKYGEKLDIFRHRCDDGSWLVEGRVGGELRIQMKVTFGG